MKLFLFIGFFILVDCTVLLDKFKRESQVKLEAEKRLYSKWVIKLNQAEDPDAISKKYG
jgi:hypothetical protein